VIPRDLLRRMLGVLRLMRVVIVDGADVARPGVQVLRVQDVLDFGELAQLGPL